MTGAPRTAQRWTGGNPPGYPVSIGLAVSGVITALTLVVSFALLALGVEDFWVAYPVGFGVVLPTALGAVTYALGDADGRDGRSRGGDYDQDPRRDREAEGSLDELRMQYARGELSDDEFERRTERLLERSEER